MTQKTEFGGIGWVRLLAAVGADTERMTWQEVGRQVANMIFEVDPDTGVTLKQCDHLDFTAPQETYYHVMFENGPWIIYTKNPVKKEKGAAIPVRIPNEEAGTRAEETGQEV